MLWVNLLMLFSIALPLGGGLLIEAVKDKDVEKTLCRLRMDAATAAMISDWCAYAGFVLCLLAPVAFAAAFACLYFVDKARFVIIWINLESIILFGAIFLVLVGTCYCAKKEIPN